MAPLVTATRQLRRRAQKSSRQPAGLRNANERDVFEVVESDDNETGIHISRKAAANVATSSTNKGPPSRSESGKPLSVKQASKARKGGNGRITRSKARNPSIEASMQNQASEVLLAPREGSVRQFAEESVDPNTDRPVNLLTPDSSDMRRESSANISAADNVLLEAEERPAAPAVHPSKRARTEDESEVRHSKKARGNQSSPFAHLDSLVQASKTGGAPGISTQNQPISPVITKSVRGNQVEEFFSIDDGGSSDHGTVDSTNKNSSLAGKIRKRRRVDRESDPKEDHYPTMPHIPVENIDLLPDSLQQSVRRSLHNTHAHLIDMHENGLGQPRTTMNSVLKLYHAFEIAERLVNKQVSETDLCSEMRKALKKLTEDIAGLRGEVDWKAVPNITQDFFATTLPRLTIIAFMALYLLSPEYGLQLDSIADSCTVLNELVTFITAITRLCKVVASKDVKPRTTHPIKQKILRATTPVLGQITKTLHRELHSRKAEMERQDAALWQHEQIHRLREVEAQRWEAAREDLRRKNEINWKIALRHQTRHAVATRRSHALVTQRLGGHAQSRRIPSVNRQYQASDLGEDESSDNGQEDEIRGHLWKLMEQIDPCVSTEERYDLCARDPFLSAFDLDVALVRERVENLAANLMEVCKEWQRPVPMWIRTLSS